MKCDREQRPGANFRISHVNGFLTSLGRHVPLKINMGFAKVWRKYFFCEDYDVFRMKEFRTALVYFCIYIIYIYKIYASQSLITMSFFYTFFGVLGSKNIILPGEKTIFPGPPINSPNPQPQCLRRAFEVMLKSQLVGRSRKEGA